MRALCIEDDIVIAMESKAVLEQLGFGNIYVAFTYRDAKFVVEHDVFDVAILDVNLGGGRDTPDLARELVSRGTQVVFTSRFAFARGLVSGLGIPILEKPLDFTELSALLKNLELAR